MDKKNLSHSLPTNFKPIYILYKQNTTSKQPSPSPLPLPSDLQNLLPLLHGFSLRYRRGFHVTQALRLTLHTPVGRVVDVLFVCGGL